MPQRKCLCRPSVAALQPCGGATAGRNNSHQLDRDPYICAKPVARKLRHAKHSPAAWHDAKSCQTSPPECVIYRILARRGDLDQKTKPCLCVTPLLWVPEKIGDMDGTSVALQQLQHHQCKGRIAMLRLNGLRPSCTIMNASGQLNCSCRVLDLRC